MRKNSLFLQVFASAIIAAAFVVPLTFPAAAQLGCNPYVGGSCGYQDTHPPVPWRGQNRYYNGNGIGLPAGVRRGPQFYNNNHGNRQLRSVERGSRMKMFTWGKRAVTSTCTRHVKHTHCVNGNCTVEEFDKACD